MATIDELRHLLARASWWTGPRTWIQRDPDLIQARKAPFEYSAGALGDLVPGGLYLLRGPRRVGKSVELKKTVERLIASGTDPRRILHVAADRLVASDLQRIVDVGALLAPRAGPRFWFIDEITAITDGWPAAIKVAARQRRAIRSGYSRAHGFFGRQPGRSGQGACRETRGSEAFGSHSSSDVLSGIRACVLRESPSTGSAPPARRRPDAGVVEGSRRDSRAVVEPAHSTLGYLLDRGWLSPGPLRRTSPVTIARGERSAGRCWM